jgi:hypothetical protein
MNQELNKIISDLEYAAYNLCNGKKDTDLPPGIINSTGAEDSLLIAIRDLKEITNRHEPLVSGKLADFTVSELMIKMNEIIGQYPVQGNYADDGRYTYPGRWNALLKYIKEK